MKNTLLRNQEVNVNRTGKFFLSCLPILFLFLLIVPTINAAVVVQVGAQVVEYGLDVEYKLFDVLKQGEDYNYTFHVFNLSNGVKMDNRTTSCVYHLFNSSGDIILDLNVSSVISPTMLHFNVFIASGNFSNVGDYGYLLYCEAYSGTNNTLGGYVSAPFKVTPTGYEISDTEAIVGGGLLLSTIFLAAFFCYFGFKLVEKEKLFIEGMVFLIASLFLSTVPLMLGYLFSRDILFSLSVTGIMFKLWFAMFWVLFALIILRLLVFLIQVMKQVFRTRQQKRYGEGYDMKTKQYK